MPGWVPCLFLHVPNLCRFVATILVLHNSNVDRQDRNNDSKQTYVYLLVAINVMDVAAFANTMPLWSTYALWLRRQTMLDTP
eukprot:5511772-Pleurochrysis_carterae.AAC.8